MRWVFDAACMLCVPTAAATGQRGRMGMRPDGRTRRTEASASRQAKHPGIIPGGLGDQQFRPAECFRATQLMTCPAGSAPGGWPSGRKGPFRLNNPLPVTTPHYSLLRWAAQVAPPDRVSSRSSAATTRSFPSRISRQPKHTWPRFLRPLITMQQPYRFPIGHPFASFCPDLSILSMVHHPG